MCYYLLDVYLTDVYHADVELRQEIHEGLPVVGNRNSAKQDLFLRHGR
ncbi:transposase [Streptomyces sp. SID3343]|nr:transposase [Streptomyces sp. SID3343]